MFTKKHIAFTVLYFIVAFILSLTLPNLIAKLYAYIMSDGRSIDYYFHLNSFYADHAFTLVITFPFLFALGLIAVFALNIKQRKKHA